MASFTDYLTVEGERMLAKAVAGTKVSFTKAVMGSGYLPSGTYEKNVSAVMTPEQEVPIQSVTINSSSSVLISAYFSNKNLDKGFYFREKALYMSDGTDEVLAIYGNNGADAEYIDKGDSCVIEKLLKSVIELTSQEMANIEIVNGLYEFAPIIESEETSLEDFVKTVQAKAIRMGQRVIINKMIAYTYVGDDPTDTGSYITGARMSDEYKVKLAGGDAKGGIGASQHALVDVHEEAVAADEKATAAAEKIADHMADKDNPHEVTADQIGALTLQKIIDDLEELKALTEKGFVPDALLLQTVLSTLSSHVADTDNPHHVTKAQLGLGNVDNTADSAKSVKNADTVDGKHFTDIQADAKSKADYVKAYIRAQAVDNGLCTNALQINTKMMFADANKPRYVYKGGTSAIPSDLSAGLRFVEYYNASNVRVIIDGWDTAGRPKQWFARYDGKNWTAWYSTPILNATLDLHLFGHNLMTVARVQAPDNADLIVSSGHGTGGALRLLTNTSVECTNTNRTAYMPVRGLSFTNPSSKLVKENIQDMTEEEAKKILDVRIVDFDYKEAFGGQKDQEGVIAEELLKLFPHAVTVPEGYNEKDFDESKGLKNQILSVDYAKLVSPLIKLVQMQQKQIDELTEAVRKAGK